MYSKKKYFIESRSRLKERSFFIKLFSVVENIDIFKISSSIIVKDSCIINLNPHDKNTIDKHFQVYDLVLLEADKNKYYGFISKIILSSDEDILTLEINIIKDYDNSPLFKFSEQLEIDINEIENYSGSTKIKSSYGRYFLNYVLFVYPFGDKIEYVNDIFSSKLVDNIVVQKLIDKKVTIEEFINFEDALFTYGHFAEICVPTVTLKSLTVDDEIVETRKRLIEENKDKLSDPLVAKKINDVLIKMEKERLKGDPSERFYNSRGNSSWNVQRSKMMLNVGGVPDFSDEVGKISYIPQPLIDGWDKNNFDAFINETFKGSYTRGVGTQLGGTQTKIILRMFQGSKIREEDCKSIDGIEFNISEKNIKTFDGMYEAGTNKQINKDTYKYFINKKVKIRSPMTCKVSGSGYCYMCWGDLYRKRGAKSVELDGVYVSSKFMLLQMKNMHGTEIATTTIDLNKYFISNL